MTQSEDNDLYSENQCSCMWKQNTVFLKQDVRWDLNKFPDLFNHRIHIIFYHSNQLLLSKSIITAYFKHKITFPSLGLQYSDVHRAHDVCHVRAQRSAGAADDEYIWLLYSVKRTGCLVQRVELHFRHSGFSIILTFVLLISLVQKRFSLLEKGLSFYSFFFRV